MLRAQALLLSERWEDTGAPPPGVDAIRHDRHAIATGCGSLRHAVVFGKWVISAAAVNVVLERYFASDAMRGVLEVGC